MAVFRYWNSHAYTRLWVWLCIQTMSGDVWWDHPLCLSTLWTTRGPIHVQGLSEQGGKILLSIREKSWEDSFPFFFFCVCVDPYWPLTPTVDILENWESAVAPRVHWTRPQPSGLITSPSHCSINGWQRRWSCGDILKRNLWTTDMSMTGAA